MRAGWEIKVYNSKNGQSTTFTFRVEDEFIHAWRKLQCKKKQFPYLELTSDHYYDYDDSEIDPSCSDEFKILCNKKDPIKTGRIGWCIAIWDNKRDISKYLTFWEEAAYNEAWDRLQKKFAPFPRFKLSWNLCTEYEDNDEEEIAQINDITLVKEESVSTNCEVVEILSGAVAVLKENIIEEIAPTKSIVSTQLNVADVEINEKVKFKKLCKCGCDKAAISLRGNNKFASYECRIKFDSQCRINKNNKSKTNSKLV